MNAGLQESVQKFIEHHVFRHTGSKDVWNVPFYHINALEWLRYDAVMLGVVVLLLCALALRVRHRYQTIPKGFAALTEFYVLFIRDHICYANLGEVVGRRFVSFFCTLFIFILLGNVLGLIPIFSTVTGNVSVTAGLAMIFMVVCFYAVLRIRGIRGLVTAFVPHGLPGWMLPMMVVMEIISFFSRVFALTIRLFCNMLAGHIVIYSLIGMTIIYGWVGAPAVGVAVLMYFFELFVAFLQAYIFTLLSAIFINIMVNPEH
ncbi:MAG: F0F1 ATP synthase subunit A [bacterium]